MIISNMEFYLKGTISSSAIAGDTFTISNDTELSAPINTGGEVVSIVLKSSTQRERMTVTILNSVCTIVARGITQAGGVELESLNKSWTEGVLGYITVLDFDLIDKDGANNTVSSDMTYTGYVDIKGSLKLPVFDDTTARGVAYTTPVAGNKCFISGVGEQNYDGSQWNTLGVSTPTPDATEILSGKVELPTDTQITNGDATGETGAALTPTNAQTIKSISLKGAVTTTSNIDEFVINQLGVDKRITQTNIREQLAGDTTQKGTFEMATDVEAEAKISETLVINPKQLGFSQSITPTESLITDLADFTISSGTGEIKGRQITVQNPGTYRIRLHVEASTPFSVSSYVKKNGVTELTSTTADVSGIDDTVDILCTVGDTIEFWGEGALTDAEISAIQILGTPVQFTVDL